MAYIDLLAVIRQIAAFPAFWTSPSHTHYPVQHSSQHKHSLREVMGPQTGSGAVTAFHKLRKPNIDAVPTKLQTHGDGQPKILLSPLPMAATMVVVLVVWWQPAAAKCNGCRPRCAHGRMAASFQPAATTPPIEQWQILLPYGCTLITVCTQLS